MTLQQDSERDDVRALADRLGVDAFERRLQREADLAEKRGDRRSLSRFEPHLDLYALIRLCLKACGLWGRAVRNYLDVRVVENIVPMPNLPEVFDGYRILQLTDLHADLHPDFVESVRSAVESVDYDLIVITGDFRSATYGDYTGAIDAVIEIAEVFQAACYCVLGNHDTISKVPRLEAAGLRCLLNEQTHIERNGERLYLVGIDDPNHYQTHDFARALAGVPADACKVLLSHSPETYQTAAELGFDLQLSGHTHGGQICLPGGFVLVHDGTSPRRLLKGTWAEGGLQGYTSNGTGGTGVPVRLNCPAEITLHTLRMAPTGDEVASRRRYSGL